VPKVPARPRAPRRRAARRRRRGGGGAAEAARRGRAAQQGGAAGQRTGRTRASSRCGPPGGARAPCRQAPPAAGARALSCTPRLRGMRAPRASRRGMAPPRTGGACLAETVRLLLAVERVAEQPHLVVRFAQRVPPRGRAAVSAIARRVRRGRGDGDDRRAAQQRGALRLRGLPAHRGTESSRREPCAEGGRCRKGTGRKSSARCTFDVHPANSRAKTAEAPRLSQSEQRIFAKRRFGRR